MEEEEQGPEEAFLEAEKEAQADHLKPGWSLNLLQLAPAPQTPLSYKQEPGTPPDSLAPSSPALPGTPPNSPAPSSPALPGPSSLPAPNTPLAAPNTPGPSKPALVELEGSEEETAQLASLKGFLRAPLKRGRGF